MGNSRETPISVHLVLRSVWFSHSKISALAALEILWEEGVEFAQEAWFRLRASPPSLYHSLTSSPLCPHMAKVPASPLQVKTETRAFLKLSVTPGITLKRKQTRLFLNGAQ